eukprot:6943228-Pyramimonas_sp.AAC.1
MPSRIEGVAISPSAEGGGRPAKGGRSRTRPPPPAEAGGRPTEGGGSQGCAPRDDAFGQSWRSLESSCVGLYWEPLGPYWGALGPSRGPA